MLTKEDCPMAVYTLWKTLSTTAWSIFVHPPDFGTWRCVGIQSFSASPARTASNLRQSVSTPSN